MVISRNDIKRKRSKECAGLTHIVESPKRTKVHAQRKFAQGSNVSSPVITTVPDPDGKDKPRTSETLRTPELLPAAKRPNTEDFLTFLCFRGTPMLPSSLNFFSTVSVQQSQEPLKPEENASCIDKTVAVETTASTTPTFIAFGVRKRADPFVNNKLEKKRRQTLALQALRRKYQEQRMAKIRSVTISQLAQKVRGKNLVRTRSITKNESVSTKNQKTTKVNVVTTKIATRRTITIKHPMNKQRMCLRSRSGRYIHRELITTVKKRCIIRKNNKRLYEENVVRRDIRDASKSSSEFSSDDDQPLVKAVAKKFKPVKSIPKSVKHVAPIIKRNAQIRVTRTTGNAKQSDACNNANPSQRPTRKTKEAAAIYMELLGHKLVNDVEVDEDDVSIDSFPELPNVRKTEQREIELKAKIQPPHQKPKGVKSKLVKISTRSNTDRTKCATAEETVKVPVVSKIIKPNKIHVKKAVATSAVVSHKILRSNRTVLSATKKNVQDLHENVDRSFSFSDSDEEPLSKLTEQKLLRKSKALLKSRKVGQTMKKKITIITRRRKIEMKRLDKAAELKRVERVAKRNQTDCKNMQRVARKADERVVKRTGNVKAVVETVRKKTVEPQAKSDIAPKKIECVSKDTEKVSKGAENASKPIEVVKKVTELRKTRNDSRKVDGKPVHNEISKPQSNVPIMSDDDEDKEVFHGFFKPEDVDKSKTKCSHVVASADLLCKDVGKRFGKGKVNMSIEQIEKWIKDSVMAGKTLRTEDEEDNIKYDDKALLFTDDITKHEDDIDIKLEKFSLTDKPIPLKTDAVLSTTTTPIINNATVNKTSAENKDKKSIFQPRRSFLSRDKKDTFTKNVNAFSVQNESSVYAFEADTEETISTPFRRPSRRPSSTTTSRSEDEQNQKNFEINSSETQNKQPDDSNQKPKRKVGNKLNLPPIFKPETAKININQEIKLIQTNEYNITTQGNLPIGKEKYPVMAQNVGKTEGNDGHVFYIPLQPSSMPNPGGQVIKGVAVKLDTEGANGPNQRVVMRAKLVTQSTMSSTLENRPAATGPMCPPKSTMKSNKYTNVKNQSPNQKSTDIHVPSSPSASSSSSIRVCKKPVKPRVKPLEFCTSISAKDFPKADANAQMVDAPTFHPTDKEFQDPIEYIEKVVRPQAEKFGICRIVPPANFKPECKVTDDMRFTAYNQYVHKMLHRWGPNFKELMAIKKYLETQSITLTHPPWIGGMEIDLPRLYQTVQTLGGLKEVIEKKKWPKVAEGMKIPKSAQDRVTKLDDIYCKYLLPYDTLSPGEREKLFNEVETDWAKRESHSLLRSQQTVDQTNKAAVMQTSNNSSNSEASEDDEFEECIVKGRNMALNAFYRIARNTMSMWFRTTEPSAQDVEMEFWKHVQNRQNHLCVHSGSIDSGSWGYGFACSKNSPFARHAWNLKVMTNNSGSILRSMGPVMGVTVPTLHVGMVFSAVCWYRDPHALPWIEYLHTGANKIWYGIPDSFSEKFHSALLKLVPNYCRNKKLWLSSDTAMVPPSLLVQHGVSLCRIVQEPGQFIVVFPKAFTSSLCTGYVVSESVYFAPPKWLGAAQSVFEDIRDSCEPSMFSLERLIISIANDTRSNAEVLKLILPIVKNIVNREKAGRKSLEELGLKNIEKLPLPEAPCSKKRKKLRDDEGEYECEDCRSNLFVSLLTNTVEELDFCLDHAIEHVKKNKNQVKNCKLIVTYDGQDLDNLILKLDQAIENKLMKKVPGRYSGLPTLLK